MEFNLIWELNAAFQKLILHSFVLHFLFQILLASFSLTSDEECDWHILLIDSLVFKLIFQSVSSKLI